VNYNIVVFGGGPSGCAAALALVQSGCHGVAIVTRQQRHWPPVELLATDIRESLTTLGLWERFLSLSPFPCPGIISRWGSKDALETDFLFNPYGSGWLISRERFDVMLMEAVKSTGIDWIVCDRCNLEGTQHDDSWRFEVHAHNNFMKLQARWVVDATGRTAWLARRLGSRREVASKHLAVGVEIDSGALRTKRDMRLWLEKTHNGWWYAIPSGMQNLLIVFVTDANQLPSRSFDRSAWLEKQLLETRDIKQLVKNLSLGKIVIFPTAQAIQNPICGNNWLAAGDAALSLEPLSGRGTVHALETGVKVSQAIVDVNNNSSDALGTYSTYLQTKYLDAVATAKLYHD